MKEIDFKKPIECVESIHSDKKYKYIGMIPIGDEQHANNLSNKDFRYIIRAENRETLFFVDIYGRIPNGRYWIRNKKEVFYIHKDAIREVSVSAKLGANDDDYVKIEL